MAKFDIPKFKYLFQDENGDIWICSEEPEAYDDEWLFGNVFLLMFHGEENPNWRDTLIDMDKDDHEFEDGILRRIDK